RPLALAKSALAFVELGGAADVSGAADRDPRRPALPMYRGVRGRRARDWFVRPARSERSDRCRRAGGRGTRARMNTNRVDELWSQAGAPWSAWVKPILFA